MTDQSLMQKYIKIVGVVALYWSVSVSLVYGLYAYKHWRNMAVLSTIRNKTGAVNEDMRR